MVLVNTRSVFFFIDSGYHRDMQNYVFDNAILCANISLTIWSREIVQSIGFEKFLFLASDSNSKVYLKNSNLASILL